MLFSENDFYFVGFIFLLASVFVLLVSSERGNVLHVSWLISFVVFSLVPFFVFFVFFDEFDYRIILISVFFSFLFLFLTKGFLVERRVGKIPYHGALVFVFPLIGLLLLFVFPDGSLGYILFSSIYLIFIHASTFLSPRDHFIRVMVPFFVYFVVFYSFFWGGFGRLILAANLLIPLLVFLYSYGIRFNVLYIYAASAFFSVAMNLLRFKDGGDFLTNFVNDSTVGPYAMSVDFMDKVDSFEVNFSGYFDQFLLMFFAFVPRFLWESKPIGFGRYYVEQDLNVYDYGEGHSIAALFIGESVYYLGWLWWLGLFISVISFYFLLKLLGRLNSKYFVLPVVVGLYIPTFYWGGYASFGSRFTLSMLLVFGLLGALYLGRKLSKIY